MKKTITIVVIVLVIIIGVYFISSNKTPSVSPAVSTPSVQVPITSEPQAQMPVSSTPAVSPQLSASVSIKNFAFNPSSLAVKAGTKVTWTNNDSVAHTVTSDAGNMLNSGTIAPGESFSFTFASSGSFNYHCSVHPMMKGTVITN